MKLNDQSPMPYGKFKGDKMEKVPASYLLWLRDNEKASRDVLDYINENETVLFSESKDYISDRFA